MLDADAVVSDPPYGIVLNTNYRQFHDSQHGVSGASHLRREWPKMTGDTTPFDPRPWLRYPQLILWGANNYAPRLPLGSWLFWDKRATNGHALKSEGEMAWWNKGQSVYYFPHCWHGFARASENSVHVHPTQKPIALMAWCLRKTRGRVLDPFMGSGPTGIACVQLGRAFIGVEIEPRYFDLACQRITAAYAQPDLFAPTPTRPQQQPLFAAGGV